MGILWKDLIDFDRPHTNTKVEFGAADYWVEWNQKPQPYGTALTEVLNYDPASFQSALDALEHVVQMKDLATAPKAFLDTVKEYASLPLYRLYLVDLRDFAEMPVEDFVQGEAREAFAEDIVNGAYELPGIMRQRLQEVRFIQRRYGWFLESLSKNVPYEKKKGQRKAPLAAQIRKHCLEPYVRGVSLGEDPVVDAPQVNIQFALKEQPKRAPELVERLYFDRLPDFIYVEMMRGLQRGFVPKRCPNCGRWFLQTPGATYSYCDGPAPGEEGKTCRDVGATASFQSKVQNNDIWKLHQRAYKKYFARTRKGTMSKADFEAWSREAEDLRNKALERYSQADGETEREQIVQKLKEKLNRI